MSDGIKLLINGAHGVYVPQCFVQNFDMTVWDGVNDEDIEILKAGPDHEHYWEVWDDVLGNATHTDIDGNKWYLMQDGDLWAYCQEKMTLLERDDFDFEVDFESMLEHHGYTVKQHENGAYYWVRPDGTPRFKEFYTLRQCLRDCVEYNQLEEPEE